MRRCQARAPTRMACVARCRRGDHPIDALVAMLSVGSMQTHTWLIFAGLALGASCTGLVAESSAELADPSTVSGADGSVGAPRWSSGAIAGAWDPRFTVAGFTGPDGHAPTVYDFARDIDGSIVAAGEFRSFGHTRVEPLL